MFRDHYNRGEIVAALAIGAVVLFALLLLSLGCEPAPVVVPVVAAPGTCVPEIRAWTDAEEALYEQYERMKASEDAMKACAEIR